MARRRQRASECARWEAAADLWLDHAVVEPADAEWMGHVERLTLWNVRLPASFLAGLPRLSWLDVRGGTGLDAELVVGCVGVRYLQINQVRGLCDLSAVAGLEQLELLSLYGLPRVAALPDMSALRRLHRVELGSMRGLASLAPLSRAPALEQLLFHKAVGLTAADVDALVDLPRLRTFEWFGEDVPDRVVEPVRARMSHLPRTRAVLPAAWFAGNGESV